MKGDKTMTQDINKTQRGPKEQVSRAKEQREREILLEVTVFSMFSLLIYGMFGSLATFVTLGVILIGLCTARYLFVIRPQIRESRNKERGEARV